MLNQFFVNYSIVKLKLYFVNLSQVCWWHKWLVSWSTFATLRCVNFLHLYSFIVLQTSKGVLYISFCFDFCNAQICWDHGSCIFQRCMALCMAHVTGSWLFCVYFCCFHYIINSCLTCFSYATMQNDLIHGWGLDFALRRCVEVSSLSFFDQYLLCHEIVFWNLFCLDADSSSEDRSCWYSVDCPPKRSFSREPGKWSIKVLFTISFTWIEWWSFLCFFNRGKQRVEGHHGKGYVWISSSHNWITVSCAFAIFF